MGRMHIDHVVVAVRDLASASDRFARRFGLIATGGGEHAQWGTANAIIPVGSGQFIELLAVRDASLPHPMVAVLGALVADGDRIAGLCLRPDDFDAEVARLGLTSVDAEREADGEVLRWRLAGMEMALGPERLPFFIDWQGGEGTMDAANDAAASTSGIAWIEYGGDARRVRSWVANDDVPLRLIAGDPGPHRLALVSSSGEELIVDERP